MSKVETFDGEPRESDVPTTRADFYALAKRLETEHGLTRRQAMQRVKRLYPKAREAFKLGQLPG